MDLILHDLRNPATGFWGERYVHHDGQTEFVDNLSITFHVVRYLDGEVPDMDKVVATTLAVKDLDFPSGWRLNGHYWDHLNMDVAELFRQYADCADTGLTISRKDPEETCLTCRSGNKCTRAK